MPPLAFPDRDVDDPDPDPDEDPEDEEDADLLLRRVRRLLRLRLRLRSEVSEVSEPLLLTDECRDPSEPEDFLESTERSDDDFRRCIRRFLPLSDMVLFEARFHSNRFFSVG